MHHERKLLVTAHWDDEAKVWVATSEDIPGLVTEAFSLDRLIRRVLDIAPELIELNGHLMDDGSLARESVEVCVQAGFVQGRQVQHAN
jgi:hypothetical protein